MTVLATAAPGPSTAVPPWLLAAMSALTWGTADGEPISPSAEALVVGLFRSEGRSLVRLARLFVDDRDAAEDLVQEAFLRLARNTSAIQDIDRAPAYLRSIVLNLARDHNRRGLVSLRHLAAAGPESDAVADHATELTDRLCRDRQHAVLLERVRELPRRQRDCITLRYFEELSIDEIASTIGVSANSVKTHLQRGMRHLADHLNDSAVSGLANDGERE